MARHRIHYPRAVALLVTGGLAAASGAASAPTTGHRLVANSAETGAKIAFVSGHGGGPANKGTVYVVNADGSGRRVVARKVWDFTPAWSPDGRKLAFVRGVDANSELYVVNADGSGERRLTRNPALDGGQVWSPDGRTIAFVRFVPTRAGGGRRDLYVMNADGSSERRLSRNAGGPVWSPDGRKIAFVRGDDIHVMNPDGSGQRNLTRDASYEDSPAWSPDGRMIAFVTSHGGCCPAKADLYVMNADGSGKRRLAHAPAGISAPPTWSPDGQKIAFDRAYQPYPKTPSKRFYFPREIYVMNVDGSGRRRLMDGGRPLWSPDGRKILFVRPGRVVGGLYVMNADGSGQRRVARSARGVAWSPGQ